MKFKVLKGSPIFEKLEHMMSKIKSCWDASHELSESVGAKGVCTFGYHRAGGIGAFQFAPDKFPSLELWKQTDPRKYQYRDLFYPRSGKKYKQNDELHAKIAALPVVEKEEYNKVIGYEGGWLSSYGLKSGNGYFLIEIPEDSDYKPLEDMIEILESEYRKLKEEAIKYSESLKSK